MFSGWRKGGDDYGGDLYLHGIGYSVNARLTGNNHSSESGAVVSPGMRMAALTEGNGTSSEFRLTLFSDWRHLDDSQSVLLFRNNLISRWGNAAWSPRVDNGMMHLAYTTNEDPALDFKEWHDFDIWVVDVPIRKWQPEDVQLKWSGSLFSEMSKTIRQTEHRLTRDDSNESDVVWSPDGSQIAFVSDRNGLQALYVLDTDGVNKNIRCITCDVITSATHPTWSPDGKWLAFASKQNGNSAIYVIGIDGSGLHRLTFNTGNDFEPTWSPDGEWIAYLSSNGGVTLIRPDGSDQQVPFDGDYPTWVPLS